MAENEATFENVATALERCDELAALVEEFGENVPEQTVGLISRVLRRQAMLPALLVEAVEQRRDLTTGQRLLLREIISDVLMTLGVNVVTGTFPVPDKPVPGQTPQSRDVGEEEP